MFVDLQCMLVDVRWMLMDIRWIFGYLFYWLSWSSVDSMPSFKYTLPLSTKSLLKSERSGANNQVTEGVSISSSRCSLCIRRRLRYIFDRASIDSQYMFGRLPIGVRWMFVGPQCMPVDARWMLKDIRSIFGGLSACLLSSHVFHGFPFDFQ